MAETKNKIRTPVGELTSNTAEEAEFIPEETGTGYWEEKVPYRLFRDSGKYSEPVFVSVNGRAFLIPRGKTVNIPRYVAQALDDSEALKNEAATKSDQMEADFLNESMARNIKY